MDNFYKESRKRTMHFSPYSGGGSHAGHDGSTTISGVKGVEVEIIPRDEEYFQPIETRPQIRSTDPYKRRCDFGNQFKAIN